MQRLSMIALTAFAVLALSGAGFKKRPAIAPSPAPTSGLATTLASASPAKKKLPSYYWYSTFDGSYNDYETTNYEIWEMEVDYDVLVNQDPAGGTLIEEGFLTEADPNPDGPMVFLYGHF
jgi:hypothetical protein